MEVMQAVEAFVLGMAGSPWILLAVVVLATIDGFFPPVPSESVVIAVAVLSVAGDGPSLWLLVLAAALGAFCGDLIAYTIGTKVPIADLRIFRGRRGRASLAWAARTLARNGTVFILSARFVPIGRVAVNMTAGAVGFPRRRFILIAGIAAVVWGTYSTLMGLGAGHFLHEHPLVAVAVGVAGGVVAGFLVDQLLRAVQRRWFPDLPPTEVRMHVAAMEEAAQRAEAAEREAAEREAAEREAAEREAAEREGAGREAAPAAEQADLPAGERAGEATEPAAREHVPDAGPPGERAADAREPGIRPASTTPDAAGRRPAVTPERAAGTTDRPRPASSASGAGSA